VSRAKFKFWLLTFWFTSLNISWAQAEVGSETEKPTDLETLDVSTASDSSHPAEIDPKASSETTNAEPTDRRPVAIHPPSHQTTNQLNTV